MGNSKIQMWRYCSELILFLLITSDLGYSLSLHRTASRTRQTARLLNNQTVEISVVEENLEVWGDTSSPDFNFWEDVDEKEDDDITKEGPSYSPYRPSFDVALNHPAGASEDDDTGRDISVSVSDCGSPGAVIKNCSINGCTGEPCVVRRGSNITLSVTFLAKTSATNLWCGITAKKELIKKAIKCPQNDMCNAPGMRCPLRSYAQYNLAISYFLPPKIPSWTWYVEGRLWDSHGTLICIGAHAKVV